MKNPSSAPPANKAITLLRVILWLLPAFIVPFIFVISEIYTNDWFAAVIPALLVLGGLGWFDQVLCRRQRRMDLTKERPDIIRGALIFAVLQLAITPAVAFTVIYGFCMITDTGFH